MTICLAAICDNGSRLVVASDSMITNPALSIEFEHLTKKMTELSDRCVALTAGDALAHTELFNSVQDEIEKLKSPTLKNIISKIKECYQEIRKRDLVLNEENERCVRELIRKEYGMSAYARLNLVKIDLARKQSDVGIDGLYSWDE